MLPKNSKHFIQPTAEELELDINLVNDIVNFFYEQVKRDLNNLVHHNVHVDSLGTFFVVNARITPLIERHKKHLEVLTRESFDQISIKKNVEKRYNDLINLSELINQESKRRKQFFLDKYETNR
jgi:hypothetical protein